MNVIYGIPVSPFVKKVVATLKLKGINYKVSPVMPHDLSDEFKRISHLGKIPAFKDEDIELYDSAVICSYLDGKYPENSIYPTNNIKKALVLLFEQYAGSKLFELLAQGIFYERKLKTKFTGKPTDVTKVDNIIKKLLPPELIYLESKLHDKYIVGDDITIADFAIGSMFLNASYADYSIDSNKYPKLALYLENLFKNKVFSEIIEDDKKLFASF